MTYKVIGQFTPNIELSTEITGTHMHNKNFETYTDANDYYANTLSEMAQNISDIGGDFMITLMGGADETYEIIKRHALTTTIMVL